MPVLAEFLHKTRQDKMASDDETVNYKRKTIAKRAYFSPIFDAEEVY